MKKNLKNWSFNQKKWDYSANSGASSKSKWKYEIYWREKVAVFERSGLHEIPVTILDQVMSH